MSFFLSAFRDLEGPKNLFRRTLRTGAHRQRRVIHTDLAPTYDSAITALQYLNIIIEEEHPASRKRVNANQGLSAARRTIDCHEAAHRIRKGQAGWLPGHDAQRQIRIVKVLFGIST